MSSQCCPIARMTASENRSANQLLLHARAEGLHLTGDACAGQHTGGMLGAASSSKKRFYDNWITFQANRILQKRHFK